MRPREGMAGDVASVPYDTVNTEEARVLAEHKPWSFLRIVRPEIELADDIDIHDDRVYEHAARNFQKFRKKNVLVRDGDSAVFVYRQVMGDHLQSGVVACSHIEDYENDLIKKHEKTRQDKEDDRARHIRTLNANAGPVLMTYRDKPAIDGIVSEVEQGDPLYDIMAPGGVQHTIWKADEACIVDAFKEVAAFYIADGHHRAAAAARVGREKREADPGHTGDEEYNWFLTVLFPAGQLQILPYNRCVHDLKGRSEKDFINAVKKHFAVTENADPLPAEPCNVSMYLGGKWYGLRWELKGDEGPVDSLDVSFLQDKLLAPVLGIEDPRTSDRIDFIGGIRGPDELARLVDSGEGAVAFSMYPCLVEQMMAIADAGGIMPPKSTWFEPKLSSGLFVHTLDGKTDQ